MKLSDIAKRMIWIIGISFIVLVAGGIIYYRSTKCLPFILGAFLGTSLNVFKIIMIERTVKKATGMEKEQVKNYVTIQHFLRFLLTGVILFLSAILQFINLWGAVAGVLSFHVAAFSMKHFTGNSGKDQKN